MCAASSRTDRCGAIEPQRVVPASRTGRCHAAGCSAVNPGALRSNRDSWRSGTGCSGRQGSLARLLRPRAAPQQVEVSTQHQIDPPRAVSADPVAHEGRGVAAVAADDAEVAGGVLLEGPIGLGADQVARIAAARVAGAPVEPVEQGAGPLHAGLDAVAVFVTSEDLESSRRGPEVGAAGLFESLRLVL